MGNSGFKLHSFKIVCDRPQAIYMPGEVISGNCIVELDGELSLSQLEIKLHGSAFCRWNESRGNTHVKHTGNCSLIELEYFPGSVNQPVITTGQHNIGFNFKLPAGMLPSSFEGSHGHIRYYVKAKILTQQCLACDRRTKLLITIKSPAFASIQELSLPVNNSSHKTIGILGSGTVSMRCSIALMGQNIGSSIPITVFINNQSKKSMILKAILKQEVNYIVKHKNKKCTQNICRVVGNTIYPFSECNELLTLKVSNRVPVIHNSCPIIHIKYFIQVTLDIPGSFDLHCSLPVILTNSQSLITMIINSVSSD